MKVPQRKPVVYFHPHLSTARYCLVPGMLSNNVDLLFFYQDSPGIEQGFSDGFASSW